MLPWGRPFFCFLYRLHLSPKVTKNLLFSSKFWINFVSSVWDQECILIVSWWVFCGWRYRKLRIGQQKQLRLFHPSQNYLQWTDLNLGADQCRTFLAWNLPVRKWGRHQQRGPHGPEKHAKEVINKFARSNRMLDFALWKFSLRLNFRWGCTEFGNAKLHFKWRGRRQLLWFGMTCSCCTPVCKRAFDSFSTSSLLSLSLHLSELDVLIEKRWRN